MTKKSKPKNNRLRFAVFWVLAFLSIMILIFTFNWHSASANNDIFNFCMSKKGDIRDECFSRLAAIKESPTICDNIKEDIKKDYCKEKAAEAAEDITACTSLSSSYWSDICFNHFAHKNKDAKLCNDMENMADRKGCIYDIALLRSNINLCLSSDRPLKCQFTIALSEKNTTICKEKITNTVNRDVCIYRIARDISDIKICDEISIRQIKENCISRLSSS